MAKQKNPAVIFKTKLGNAKGVERSRIWIEGKRLVDAGFTVGRYFAKEWPSPEREGPDMLVLTLLEPDDVLATAPCKVSGKGEKPIIDITGAKVRMSFGEHGAHVTVEYRPGEIRISVAA